jgi:hypothetical protein
MTEMSRMNAARKATPRRADDLAPAPQEAASGLSRWPSGCAFRRYLGSPEVSVCTTKTLF